MKYLRAFGFGVLWAFITLPASFAMIVLGLSLWILVVYAGLVLHGRPTDAFVVAWKWAARVWGAFAVSIATVGFFVGWMKSIRQDHTRS
jgi:phosphoglycerol transferase MdoB-like AlkP superfamily enzyme